MENKILFPEISSEANEIEIEFDKNREADVIEASAHASNRLIG
jgi:hypothetical protein